MHIESLREYCLSFEGVTEGFPFGTDTLVFKVGGKIFLLVSLHAEPLQFNVKCDPEKALEWRESYDAVLPGYHMNKKHWNTIILNGTIQEQFIREMILDSYMLVKASLPKTKKITTPINTQKSKAPRS